MVKSKKPVGLLCDNVETVIKFSYLVDRLNATDGGYEMAVTAKTRIRWMKFRECGKLLKGKRSIED